MIDDLRHATRTLSRTWTVSLAVIAAMTLCIGATTAIISVVDGVLLRPLPLTEPDRIVALETFDRAEPGRLYGRSNPWDVAGAALAAGRLLAGFLSGVAPRDPASLIAVSLMLLTFAALSAAGPAWRASRVDPIEVLRGD